MAIKIRCTECTKRISIDEAFAGGACRCPYCKAIVMVPGAAEAATSARPAAPRPDSPDAAMVDSSVLVPETVPMANPVRVQSYVALGLIAALILIMVVGAILFIVALAGEKKSAENSTYVEPPNPFVSTITGASVANDVQIAAPVVYVIDCGKSMERMIDMAAAITRVSVRTLDDQKFTIMLALSEALSLPADMPGGGSNSRALSGLVTLEDGLVGGGKAGDRLAKKFIEHIQETGRTGQGRVDMLPALKAALELKPKTIVLYTRKELEGAESVIENAKKDGIKIVILALDADSTVQQNLEKFSKATDSQSRAYGFAKLSDWSQEFFNSEE